MYATPHDGEAARETLVMRPLPYRVTVARFPRTSPQSTSIARLWRAGDPERCGRCPAGCTADDAGLCLIVVPGIVSDRDAPTYAG